MPGPALLFVVMNGVLSNGTMVIMGTGLVETQPTVVTEALPVVTTAATTPQKTSGAARGVGLVMGTVIGAALVLLGTFDMLFFRFRWVITDACAV